MAVNIKPSEVKDMIFVFNGQGTRYLSLKDFVLNYIQWNDSMPIPQKSAMFAKCLSERIQQQVGARSTGDPKK